MKGDANLPVGIQVLPARANMYASLLLSLVLYTDIWLQLEPKRRSQGFVCTSTAATAQLQQHSCNSTAAQSRVTNTQLKHQEAQHAAVHVDGHSRSLVYVSTLPTATTRQSAWQRRGQDVSLE